MATFWIPNDCIQCRGIREIQNNATYIWVEFRQKFPAVFMLSHKFLFLQNCYLAIIALFTLAWFEIFGFFSFSKSKPIWSLFENIDLIKIEWEFIFFQDRIDILLTNEYHLLVGLFQLGIAIICWNDGMPHVAIFGISIGLNLVFHLLSLSIHPGLFLHKIV